MKKEHFFDNNEISQYELSYEFLYLLKWLIENESETLRKIVIRAVRNGFKRQINPIDALEQGIQTSIIDFLDLLDSLLVEVLHEQSVKKVFDRNMIPALDQIDSKACDKAMVESSLEKATTTVEHSPEKNAKEILFKEILKRWKPQKNQLN